MTAAELTAAYGDLVETVDARTLELVSRRRGSMRRRGWLVRRMLAGADLLGLLAAFLLTEFLVGLRAGPTSVLTVWAEILLFAITLPAWIVVAKLYGLYDHDEERAAHSTVDEIVGVFHMVTVGAWIFLAATWATHL